MTEPRKLTMVQAINLALMQEMERDDDVLVLGEDIGVDGGVFRVTDGLLAKFGEQRVIDTPLAEGAIVGMAIGMAIYGLKPVPEIQFSGFSFQAFHQIENHAAPVPGPDAGPLSHPDGRPDAVRRRRARPRAPLESEEAYYAHTPGLKIVIPPARAMRARSWSARSATRTRSSSSSRRRSTTRSRKRCRWRRRRGPSESARGRARART